MSQEPTTTSPPQTPGLLAELRRRGVTRAVMGYAVAAFAALQVAEPILHALKLPDGWLTGVVLLLAAGFPVVAAVSWGWDLTRRGWVRTEEAGPSAEAEPGEAARSAPAGASRGALAAVVVASALLGAGLAWLALRPGAPPVVADADGRISVAVADFANQTGEAPLDALSGLLITSLEQSRKLKVLTRGRMFELLRQAGHEQAERVDEPLAREVGQKAGVRALLLASVVRLGGAYVVELRAVDPAKDHYLFSLREQAADPAGLLPLIDRLSDGVRRRLREDEQEVRAADIQVAQAITPNLEAYRHYFKGKELANRDGEQARDEFLQALARDPGFTLAKYELGFVSLYYGLKEIEVVPELVRNVHRLPPKEAGLVRGLDDLLAGRFAQGRTALEALERQFPDDGQVGYLSAEFVAFSGDMEGSLSRYERALRLDPENLMLLFNQVVVLQYLGRAREGLALAEANLQRRPTPEAAELLVWARSFAGDRAGALALRDRIDPENVYFLSCLGAILAAEGRASDGLALIPGGTAIGEANRSWALAYAGRRREGAAAMEAAAKDPRNSERTVRQWQSMFLAGAGEHGAARRALEASGLVNAVVMFSVAEARDERALAKLAEVGTATWGGRFATTMLAWVRGERSVALAGLRALDAPAGGFVPYFHGRLAAELGLHEEAVEALARQEGPVLLGTDGPLMGWLEARGRLTRARSLDALGRRAEARAAVERQLLLFRGADPDLPLLAEAKAVCRQVGCKAP